nr:MAG TPA: hypothetical protein [Caudoviricetes sp.]
MHGFRNFFSLIRECQQRNPRPAPAPISPRSRPTSPTSLHPAPPTPVVPPCFRSS